MELDRLESVSLFGVLLLLAAVLIVVVVPPAERYEISLYDVYPVYFWLLVGGAALIGGIVILADVMKSGDGTGDKGGTWMFGLLLLLVTNALLFLLPNIRGYPMYGRYDQLTHIGFARDIVATGTLGANIYSPTHILTIES